MKQPRAEARFDGLHAFGHHLGGHLARFGRGGEAAAFDDPHEHLHIGEDIHD